MAKINKGFRVWLETKRYGVFNGVEITPSTRLVRYSYVISYFVMTERKKTRFYFIDVDEERDKARSARMWCTLCNFTIGLLGIPWGPIFAIIDTIGNYRKPDTIPWGIIAGPVDQEPQTPVSTTIKKIL
ncbi:MAG: hypothetical protein J1E62_06510 [Lachnospiraceae bacterium]|nr:hypothetical protein [Lachnospiraceae bacterium]